MNWRIWRWWLAGILLYLLFLLATLPAVYAAAWLQKRVPQVKLSAVDGSVWSGSAQDVSLQGQSWGTLRWHFDWGALLTGHPDYHLYIHDDDVSLHGRVADAGRGKLLLRDIEGELGIRRLEPWLPLPQGSIAGQLNLQLKQVVLAGNRPLVATGVITLTSAKLAWPQALALGNYQLKLQTQDGSIDGKLLDTSGPLILAGTFTLSPGGRYQVNGTLASRDPADTALNNLLHYLPVDQTGSHSFNFSGQW